MSHDFISIIMEELKFSHLVDMALTLNIRINSPHPLILDQWNFSIIIYQFDTVKYMATRILHGLGIF